MAQPGDRIEAGLAVQMIVGENDFGSGLAGRLVVDRTHSRIGRDIAAPALEQKAHPLQDALVVVDAGDVQAVQRRRKPAALPRPGVPVGGFGDRDRHDHGEARSLSRQRMDLDFQAQDPRDAIDDGEAEAQPLGLAGAFLQAGEFAEDRAQLLAGNADAGVEDLYFDQISAPPRPDEDAPVTGIFDGVRDQVLDQAAQQVAIGPDGKRRADDPEVEPLFRGQRAKVVADLAQQFVEPEGNLLGLHGAGIEAGNVEDRAQNGLDRFQRRFDVGGGLARRSGARLLDQRGAIEARRVERLKNVVASGREEARLAEIGLFGQRLRLRQFLVEARQLGRAAAHPLLQRLVGPLQGKVRLDAGGYVGIGGDHPPVRHRIGAQFQRAAAGRQLHLPRSRKGRQPIQHRHSARRRDITARGKEIEDLVERHADLSHMVGQIEQGAVLPVPADQPEIAIEDGNALLHLVERRLQQVAIVLQRLRRIVEEPERILGIAVVAAKKQRQHQPCRRGADGAGQQLLGKADDLHAGLRVALQYLAPLLFE